MNRRIIAALLCATAVSACGKNAIQDITGPASGASVKFFNFAVNAPGVNFYANDTKVTAISSATGTESTLGTAYGAVAAGGYYTGVTPGQYTLSGRIAAATDHNVAISNIPTTLADGKYYSYYQSGFYNSATKTTDAFIVEDPFVPQIDYTVAYVRFVNAISNSNPMTLYAKSTTSGVEGAVGTAVAYKGAGTFIAVPNGVYDLSTRNTGSSTNAISSPAVSFSAGYVYTVSARGDMTITSSTATTRPALDNSRNR